MPSEGQYLTGGGKRWGVYKPNTQHPYDILFPIGVGGCGWMGGWVGGWVGEWVHEEGGWVAGWDGGRVGG